MGRVKHNVLISAQKAECDEAGCFIRGGRWKMCCHLKDHLSAGELVARHKLLSLTKVEFPSVMTETVGPKQDRRVVERTMRFNDGIPVIEGNVFKRVRASNGSKSDAKSTTYWRAKQYNGTFVRISPQYLGQSWDELMTMDLRWAPYYVSNEDSSDDERRVKKRRNKKQAKRMMRNIIAGRRRRVLERLDAAER